MENLQPPRLEIPIVQVFHLIKQNKEYVTEGKLQLIQNLQQQLHLIRINSFQYSFLKNTPIILVPYQSHKLLLLSTDQQSFFAIIISSAYEVLDQLIDILQKESRLLNQQQANQDEILQYTLVAHCNKIFEQPIVDDSKSIYYINKGGYVIKKGLDIINQYTVQGINKGGNYVQSKITIQKNVEISDNTKQRITNVKKNTSGFMHSLGQFIDRLFQPIVKIGNSVGSKIKEKIDNSNNEKVQYIKEVGKATANASNLVYKGLTNTICGVSGAIGQSTKGIIEKKFGNDLTQTILGPQEKAIDQSNVQQVPIQQVQQQQLNYPEFDDDQQQQQQKDKNLNYIQINQISQEKQQQEYKPQNIVGTQNGGPNNYLKLDDQF